MKVAGIYPQKIDLDPKTQHLLGEPIGLESVLSMARKEGHEIRMFIPMKKSQNGFENIKNDAFLEEIVNFRPDVIAFSLMTCQVDYARKLAVEIKMKIPNVRILAGGRHPTTEPEKIKPPFECYVIGEGEETFVDLLNTFNNGNDLSKVQGICYRKGKRLFFTPPRPLIRNLNSLPLSYRDSELMSQIYRGLSYPPMSKNPKIAIVEYSRGCPFRCYFCDSDSAWRRTVRYRTAKSIVDEMKILKNKYGTDLFYFMDLNFTMNRRKVLEFCNEIKKQRLEASWYCMSNIVTADKELLSVMKDAGCFRIAWGVESTNDKSLKKMTKETCESNCLTKKKAVDVLKMSADLGIVNSIFYIICFPWETEKSILKDGKALLDYEAHLINIGIATPMPGTQWRSDIGEKNIKKTWRLYDRNHMVYKHPSISPARAKQLQKHLHKEFYDNPEYLKRVNRLITISPHLKRSFVDYFRFVNMGKIANIVEEFDV